MSLKSAVVFVVLCHCALDLIPKVAFADELMQFGFGKRDITPTLPMRLSGYANRVDPAKDAVEKLRVRAMAMKSPNGNLHAIVSVDLLGLAASHNHRIAERVEKSHGIARERLVVSCTHTHTGPQLPAAATNLLQSPFTEQETRRANDYADFVIDQIVSVIGDALGQLRPGRLSYGEGRATFAMNRRLLVDGKWQLSRNPDGPVDHSLPVLAIRDVDNRLRGLIFNYACHATTLGPNDNQFNPDWPGFAANLLEAEHEGCTALSLIGCGADANPEPRTGSNQDAVSLAMRHGQSAASAVNAVLKLPMVALDTSPACGFTHATLTFDVPTVDEFKSRLEDKNITIRQHAANMLDLFHREGKLPTTYELPLQIWQFGDKLTLVFIAGEVVVDYAIRLKRDLAPGAVWVTAYANDNPAYIASERVRGEGGYEVDYSMYFYNQPGRWATGTEDVIVRRIKDLKCQLDSRDRRD